MHNLRKEATKIYTNRLFAVWMLRRLLIEFYEEIDWESKSPDTKQRFADAILSLSQSLDKCTDLIRYFMPVEEFTKLAAEMMEEDDLSKEGFSDILKHKN